MQPLNFAGEHKHLFSKARRQVRLEEHIPPSPATHTICSLLTRLDEVVLLPLSLLHALLDERPDFLEEVLACFQALAELGPLEVQRERLTRAKRKQSSMKSEGSFIIYHFGRNGVTRA